MAGGNPSKLVPCTPENARERQLKSAEKRKENNAKKKLVSSAIVEALEKKYNVGKDAPKKTGYEILGQKVIEIIAKGNSASVAMIKTILDATEGQKINLSAEVKNEMLTTEDLISEYKELAGIE